MPRTLAIDCAQKFVYSVLASEGSDYDVVAYACQDPLDMDVMARRMPGDAINLDDPRDLDWSINDNGTLYVERRPTGEGWWLPPVDLVMVGMTLPEVRKGWLVEMVATIKPIAVMFVDPLTGL